MCPVCQPLEDLSLVDKLSSRCCAIPDDKACSYSSYKVADGASGYMSAGSLARAV